MLFTVLILLVLAVVLSILLWAGTLWFQGWLYSEPAGNLYWSAPAVGVGLTLFYALWVVVDCRTGGHCGSLYKLSVSTLKQYDQINAVVKRNGKDSAEETYQKQDADYVLIGPDGRLTGTKLLEAPERIIIKDGDATMVFVPERGAAKNFKREPGQYLHYYDKSGLTIDEGNLGQVQRFHWDWLVWNVLFNMLHLGLWFVGLWLLLRYQWSHALGLAAALWLAMTLFPIPMILEYAEQTFNIAAIK
jgi:hypothetical protein